jgi:rhodanese-related sulfurtransferase
MTWCAAICLAIIAGGLGSSQPDSKNSAVDSGPPIFAYAPVMRAIEPGAQCGLYSLYAAAQALKKDVPLERLLNRQYMDSQHGSTANNLMVAATDFGLRSKFFIGLDIDTLRLADCPMLLLCDLSRNAEQTMHWVTYLGEESGLARIYDPPREVELIPFAQLQTIWTGNGLAISAENESRPLGLIARLNSLSVLWPAVLFCVAVCIGQKVVVAKNRQATNSRLRIVVPTLGVLAFVAVWGASRTLTNPNQPASNRPIAEFLKCSNSHDEIARTSELQNGVCVVDARLPLAFGCGSLPGSINLPVDASFNEWRDTVSHLDRNRPIVVYCQSEKCGWADRVASRLVCSGFSVSVLDRGYDGYITRKSNQTKDEPPILEGR